VDRLWRRFEPLQQKADEGGAAGGGGADDGDSGFESDSASVGFVEAPEDTTAQATGQVEDDGDPGATRELSASAEGVNAQGEEGDDKGAEEKGAKPEGQQGKPQAQAQAGKGKKANKPLTQRVGELKDDIDRLTHEKHKTAAEKDRAAAELANTRAELAKVQKEIADAKAAGTAAAPPADKAKPTAAAEDVEPEIPDYRKFDTDEAFEAAMADYRTKHREWHNRQMDAAINKAKKDITEGVETRFKNNDAEAAQAAANTRMATTLTEVRASKPDWNEKRDALKDIQSAWYDPKTHGDVTTPFLADLAQSRMMAGNKDGAELLYWLGSDKARAQRLADLLPSRPLRDAIVRAPSVQALLEHFATEEGAEQFNSLRRMPPQDVFLAVGALSARLESAPGGPDTTVHRITNARPSTSPRVGSPGARAGSGGGSTAANSNSFDDWMAAEDAKEEADRKRLAGIAI